MPPWLNNNKRIAQFLLRIQPQDSLEFRMNALLHRGSHPKIDDARTAALDKHKPAEIAVAGDEDPVLLVGDSE